MSTKIKAALAVNILVVIFEIIATIMNLKFQGVATFEFYTTDSNLLAGIASLIYVIYIFKKEEIPRWLYIFKYAVAGLLLVTFLVVITILGAFMPEGQFLMLFAGSALFQHLLCPLMFAISFIWLEGGEKLTVKDNVIILAPTVVYGLITGTLNVLNLMKGPYPFLMVHEQSVLMSCVWAVVILLIAYGAGLVVRKLKKHSFHAL